MADDTRASLVEALAAAERERDELRARVATYNRVCMAGAARIEELERENACVACTERIARIAELERELEAERER